MTQSISKTIKVNSTDTANQFFALSWELVTTPPRLFGVGQDVKVGDEYVCFILGWPRTLGEPQFPKHYDKEGTDT